MSEQLKLFEYIGNENPDCWLSGTPDIPDPDYDEMIVSYAGVNLIRLVEEDDPRTTS